MGFLRAELGDVRGIQNQVPPHSTDGGCHTGQAGRATVFLSCLSSFKNSVYSCGMMILRMAGDYRQRGDSRAAVWSWVFPDSTTTCWRMWEPPSLPSHAPTPRLLSSGSSTAKKPYWWQRKPEVGRTFQNILGKGLNTLGTSLGPCLLPISVTKVEKNNGQYAVKALIAALKFQLGGVWEEKRG